jgi:hypothetical protein
MYTASPTSTPRGSKWPSSFAGLPRTLLEVHQPHRRSPVRSQASMKASWSARSNRTYRDAAWTRSCSPALGQLVARLRQRCPSLDVSTAPAMCTDPADVGRVD